MSQGQNSEAKSIIWLDLKTGKRLTSKQEIDQPRQDRLVPTDKTGATNVRRHKTVICHDFWDEFMDYAKLLYRYNDEVDLYDVFMFIREQHGNRPFSEAFLKDIDREIANEEARKVK
jgi:hypothetical protein